MTPILAVIAPGVMGAAVGKRLVDNGLKVLTSLEGRSLETAARAKTAGLVPASDEEIVSVDFILSILPPRQALSLAKRFVPPLSSSKRKPVYVDCNAINPATLKEVAAAIAPTECPFVDAGIIGAPPANPSTPARDGSARTSGPRFYACGAEAPRFAALRDYGLDVRVLGGALGAASALKMCHAGIAKGATAIGVAAMYGAPANLALALPMDTPVKTLADLKGKRIGVTTTGSLTDWLVRELSRQQGWGSDGIQILALGAMQARLAAIARGELDGMVVESATGYELEEMGKARNFLLFGDIAKDFHTHVIYATDDMIDRRPDLLKRFLRGWFRTIAFMRANKDFVIQSEAKTIDVKPAIAARIYDAQIGGFSTDGTFNPAAIEVIRHSLKELGILNAVPEAKTIYNDKFVPVKY